MTKTKKELTLTERLEAYPVNVFAATCKVASKADSADPKTQYVIAVNESKGKLCDLKETEATGRLLHQMVADKCYINSLGDVYFGEEYNAPISMGNINADSKYNPFKRYDLRNLTVTEQEEVRTAFNRGGGPEFAKKINDMQEGMPAAKRF